MIVKRYLLFLICIIIIAFSFVMPKLLLQIEDLSREKEIFAKQKEERKIDVQAEKIYLVRFIHDIYEMQNEKVYYGDKNTVAVSMPYTEHIDVEEPGEEIKSEILKFVTNEIIKEVNLDDYDDYTEVANIFTPEYTVISCGLVKGKEEWIGVNIEEKTGKIINIDLPLSYLRNDIEREKQLQNYAKYLDLDIIDDWKYENQILKSEKAQLTIVLIEQRDSCMLTIAPIEVYEEYVVEDEVIKREYEIVEKEKEKGNK